MSMVFYQCGSRSSETVCVRAPTSRLGGRTLGYWKYNREQEAATGAAALVPRQWSPLPTSKIIITVFDNSKGIYTTKHNSSTIGVSDMEIKKNIIRDREPKR